MMPLEELDTKIATAEAELVVADMDLLRRTLRRALKTVAVERWLEEQEQEAALVRSWEMS